MFYECDNCKATLGPGLTACPRCGLVFDEPVPADALLDDLEPAVVETTEPPAGRPRRGPRTVAVLVLLGLSWLGYHQWSRDAVPKPVVKPAPRLPTDLAAHPQYASHMTALVQRLRAAGVGAEWPALGSNDTLLITPQVRAAEPSVTWDADTYQRLAQGIEGEFVQTRHESGFPDTDAMACFVLVTSASGQVVAVDLMGNLE